MIVPASLLFSMVTGPALVVEGDSSCPTPEAVSSELARIMAIPRIEGPPDVARVTTGGEGVWVVLRTSENVAIGERSFAPEGVCQDQARAAAVILATWFSDFHPEYRVVLPPELVGPIATPDPAAPVVPPEPAPVATSPTAVAAPAAKAPPPPAPAKSAPKPRLRLSGALAAGLELSDAGVTAAFEVSGRFAPDAAGFGVVAFALGALPASRELGSGTVDAFRWPFGVGPLARLQAGSALIDVTLGPTVGWLHLEGGDFAVNEGDDDAVFGGFAGVRVAWKRELLRPFASAGLLAWFSRSSAVASVPEAAVELPPVEGVFLVGVSLNP